VVKLLVNEPASDIARNAVNESASLSTSAITYVEATSALTRMQKGGRLSTAQIATALSSLNELGGDLFVHAVTDDIVFAASQAASKHALRAYDSLHLATALAFAKVESIAFACWDRELREAARIRGFTLVPERL
jgi:predicted nucleic acid-binding protein